jgi:hypothetical protein
MMVNDRDQMLGMRLGIIIGGLRDHDSVFWGVTPEMQALTKLVLELAEVVDELHDRIIELEEKNDGPEAHPGPPEA